MRKFPPVNKSVLQEMQDELLHGDVVFCCCDGLGPEEVLSLIQEVRERRTEQVVSGSEAQKHARAELFEDMCAFVEDAAGMLQSPHSLALRAESIIASNCAVHAFMNNPQGLTHECIRNML